MNVAPDAHEIQLDIGGMTCASCAARIEKKLNRMDGVTATVNYATEKARVNFADTVTPADLIALVEATGYTATVPQPVHRSDAAADDPTRLLRRRLTVSALLAAPVIALAMISPLQFDGWQWVSLALATPVITWGAWPFHQATWANLRHGAATMDTLISVGTVAAFGWSLYALFLGDAGDLSMRDRFSIRPERGMGSGQIYFEVASVGDHVGFAEHDLFDAHSDDLFEGFVVEGFACLDDEFAAFVGDVFGAEGVGSESLMGEGFV